MLRDLLTGSLVSQNGKNDMPKYKMVTLYKLFVLISQVYINLDLKPTQAGATLRRLHISSCPNLTPTFVHAAHV